MWLDPKAVISINTNTDEDKDVGEISSGEFPATCILKGGNERGNEESFYWFKRTGDSVFIKFSNGRQYELVWRRNLDWKSFLIRRMIAEFIPVQTEEEE